MSEAKASGKVSKEPKKAKEPKTEAATKAAEKVEKPAESTSSAKTDSAPKSAAQLSTSHFSSVSTPEYKAGWESIFGSPKSKRKAASKTNDVDEFPDQLTIEDDEIDKELREALYKAFQKKARKQGLSLAKIKKLADLEYSLECNLTEKIGWFSRIISDGVSHRLGIRIVLHF